MLAVDADHLDKAEQGTDLDREADFFERFARDGVFRALQKIDFAADEAPIARFRRLAALDEKQPAVARDCRAAADADRAHAAIAASNRAQERAPLWKDERSYFSLGEWIESSSRPKPTISASIFNSRLKTPTIGIEPPEPASTAGRPHSASNARRAR